jgi:uncharacterized membrane protein (Fun14 family)
MDLSGINLKLFKVLFLVFLSTTILIIPSAFAQVPGRGTQSLITSLFMNTSNLLTFIIELALGIGLGYFSAKVFKYILALIGIFIIGVLLNVWQSPQLSSNIQDQLKQLGLNWNNIYPVLMSLIYMLGLTTVLPITLGFIIGLVIAIFK